MIDVAFGNDFRPTTSHTVVATLNKTLAKHALKGGMEMRIYREDSLSTGNDQSRPVRRSPTPTRGRTAPAARTTWACRTTPRSSSGCPPRRPSRAPRTTPSTPRRGASSFRTTGGSTSKLTLNIGLRYEVETALTESNDKSVSGFEYGYTQPIEATVQAKYAALNDPALKALVPQLNVKGGLMFAGVDGSSRLYETPKNTFLPRFGFAYQVNPKTIIRGGAGLFAGFLGQRRGDVFPNGWSQTTTIATTTNAYGAPSRRAGTRRFSPRRSIEPVGNANGRQQGLGNAIDFFNQDPKISKQFRYQIGFQRELPGGFVVEAAYVGQLRVRHRDHQQHQRPAERVPEHGQLPYRRDERQQHLPRRLGREPVRRADAGDQLEQRDHRPLAAAAPVPAVRWTSTRRTTTASPGTTPPSSACRSGSPRATRWASPTPTRTGSRRRST